MTKIQLPKNALQRIQLGQAFAEYDIIRADPHLFVSTPATLSAMRPDNTKCFFVGRRGSGKTAIAFEVERRFPRTISIVPQIFDLLRLPLENELFQDTRQRPFKSLMHSMERALIDEVIKAWVTKGIFSFIKGPDAMRRERSLIEECDFDQRILNLTEEIFDAYRTENNKLWLRQINRSKLLIKELNEIAESGAYDFILIVDRLDESWDGSPTAVVCLMALMHAAVHLIATTKCIKPYVFIRENIYDRIRALDNEFSRLETSVVFLDWTQEKLTELVERRLVKPFNSKPPLGGEAWSYFFEEGHNKATSSAVMALCQHRPRDALMLVSYAIDSAVNHGNTKITDEDIEHAGTRYSTSRLKDLGDEFAENYPNISIVLEYFYGLGNEFAVLAMEDFIEKLLVSDAIKRHCSEWFYEYTAPFRFVELLYSIGFLGIRRKKSIDFKESSKDSNAKPSFDNSSSFVIHPTYHAALNLRSVLLQSLKDETVLRNEGMLGDLPESFRLDEYKSALQTALDNLKKLPVGPGGAKEFEEIVGNVIKLCFFRSLTNVQSKERTVDGCTIRDWVASNRAPSGFWEVVRMKYGATQIVWECKNYEELHADDFHQVNYYLSDAFGHFGIIAFRGEDLKPQYFRHIANIANKNRNGLILVLTQKDIEVFLRQAINGAFKEAHIQDRYDYTVRQIA